ncbi:hypothetical protein EVAR_50888_1 [Eumeta japonica]|uniref:Uncharacterized protein n=1 Tax=Eumeta variegata TaxID=151549 RepID=A0A4C1Y9C4_EUMVA|nr:hypothetical protein EVAR_50888_1 [Eumeta japonica]
MAKEGPRLASKALLEPGPGLNVSIEPQFTSITGPWSRTELKTRTADIKNERTHYMRKQAKRRTDLNHKKRQLLLNASLHPVKRMVQLRKVEESIIISSLQGKSLDWSVGPLIFRLKLRCRNQGSVSGHAVCVHKKRALKVNNNLLVKYTLAHYTKRYITHGRVEARTARARPGCERGQRAERRTYVRRAAKAPRASSPTGAGDPRERRHLGQKIHVPPPMATSKNQNVKFCLPLELENRIYRSSGGEEGAYTLVTAVQS